METSVNRFLDIIRAEIAKDVQVVEPGFKTSPELAAESGISESHCRHLIQEGLKRGIIERRKFRVKDGKSGLRVKYFYRIRSEVANDQKPPSCARDASHKNGKARK